MIPAQLDYVRPGSLDEALQILADREGEAKLLSGGYSLIPLIKLRLAQPALLVDMQAITGLDGIAENDDDLVIGARATHRQIDEAPVIVAKYPGITDLSGGIGDPQVRNWGTIGGSVAHADPASDWPALLLAVNATIVCRGPNGIRAIKARDFFLDTFTTAIEPTEVLTEIRIPQRRAGTGGAYTKLERKVGRLCHRRGRGPASGSTPAAPSSARASASPASRRRRTRRPRPRRPSSASGRPTRRSAPPAPPPRPRASRSPTSAAPPTTSGPWSPSSPFDPSVARPSAPSRSTGRRR